MSTFTIELPTEQAEKLTRLAERRGVRAEELLRQFTADWLARDGGSDAAFRAALTASVTENAELLRRLAQ